MEETLRFLIGFVKQLSKFWYNFITALSKLIENYKPRTFHDNTYVLSYKQNFRRFPPYQ